MQCVEKNADTTSTLDIRALSSLIHRLDDDDVKNVVKDVLMGF